MERRSEMKKWLLVLMMAMGATSCRNPSTPAGYVGYVTRGAIFGHESFYGLQTGPTSTGLGWLLRVENIKCHALYLFGEI